MIIAVSVGKFTTSSRPSYGQLASGCGERFISHIVKLRRLYGGGDLIIINTDKIHFMCRDNRNVAVNVLPERLYKRFKLGSRK
ncbi:hypothetical protein TcasGA2_TC011425 [Tribolium castaneum]|uniref:Uncharacterized protein n=1 Tax=Tribolium castaneum TaxID=7070 RepID=D6X4K4_TRICA|nr:hypothetical protein TcasGA2_TC011425 [Tribolium castaneum]